jgi:hypothetical protein
MAKKKNGGMNTNDATEATTKPKTTRPRSGTWTPIVKAIPIPGTDETTDVEFYTVEFAGETCEVRKNREGVKRGNAWVKGIKGRGEFELKVDRIRRQLDALLEMRIGSGPVVDRIKWARDALSGLIDVGQTPTSGAD